MPPHYDTPRFFLVEPSTDEDTSKSNRAKEVEAGAGKPIVPIADDIHSVIGYAITPFADMILRGLDLLEQHPTIRRRTLGKTEDISFVTFRDFVVNDHDEAIRIAKKLIEDSICKPLDSPDQEELEIIDSYILNLQIGLIHEPGKGWVDAFDKGDKE